MRKCAKKSKQWSIDRSRNEFIIAKYFYLDENEKEPSIFDSWWKLIWSSFFLLFLGTAFLFFVTISWSFKIRPNGLVLFWWFLYQACKDERKIFYWTILTQFSHLNSSLCVQKEPYLLYHIKSTVNEILMKSKIKNFHNNPPQINWSIIASHQWLKINSTFKEKSALKNRFMCYIHPSSDQVNASMQCNQKKIPLINWR